MMRHTKNQMSASLDVARRTRSAASVAVTIAASIGALIAVLLVPTLAQAGQDCTARRPDAAAMARDLDLAASVAQQLDERFHRDGVELILLARAGQDLSRHGLRYSHLGIAYRDHAAVGGRGAWRVVHKLNACGSDRSTLHRQGLAEFFSDGLFRHVAGVAVIDGLPATSRALSTLQDNGLLAQLHEPRYNMVAYPWSGPYQQSNQWALETLAALADPAVTSRHQARSWLRRHGYQAGVVHVTALERLGTRVGTAHISFDDQPFGQRMAGRIETVTVDSMFSWLPGSGLGRVLPEMRIRQEHRGEEPAPRPPLPALPSLPQSRAI